MKTKKKQRVLDMFNAKEWHTSLGGEIVKFFTYQDFIDADFAPTIEYGQKYCDVIYAKRVIQELGHRVLISSGFFIYKDKLIKTP